VLRELGLDSRLERIDEHAPLYFVREDMNIRPLLLLYYSKDIVCRPEETKLMYASLKRLMPEAVVDIAELPGGHCNHPEDENGRLMLMDKVCEFLEKIDSL